MTSTEQAVLSQHSWTPRAWFEACRSRLGRLPMSVLQLGLRVGVGMVFFKAGLLKYRSFEFAVLLFRDEYQVPVLDPALAARMTMFVELTIPVLLFAGFMSRLATLPLLGMITVIQLFVFPDAWPDHVLWGSALILVLSRGPGVLSLDYLIDRYFTKRR